MVNKVFQAKGHDTFPEEVLPLTVRFTGNSSVAAIPTLWNLMEKGENGRA